MKKIFKNKAELIDDLIKKDETVLDIGFWGQGITINDSNWVHKLICAKSGDVFGLDIDFDQSKMADMSRYKKGNAEDFDFGIKFDVIFAGDLIEHLSNPGLFLKSCEKNLKPDGRLVITTPNCFNLFNLVEKISKSEPTVNRDHTCYFNLKTLYNFFGKNDWHVECSGFLFSLGGTHKESSRKKILNAVYYFCSLFTNKFVETIVVVAKKNVVV